MHPAVTVSDLGKRYRLGERESYKALRDTIAAAATFPLRAIRGETRTDREAEYVWALRNVSFDINPGEVVGIIGRNGAGKTTLLKLLSRITEPTEGSGEIRGTVGSLLEVGTGFHPELTGRENVYLNGAVLGMKRSEVDRKFEEIIEFSGIPRFIDTPVKRYSTGMQMRLAFAVAAHLETETMLVDEVLAVGDAEFQRKCMGKMETVGSEGRTVVFVSHSMPAILRLCPRVILLDRGGVIADGPAHEVVRTYLDTGLGTTATREWSFDEAPSSAHVKLRSVRVLDDAGSVSEAVDITRDFNVEVEYWRLASGSDVRPVVTLAFTNEDGVLLFVASDLDESGDETAPGPGVGKSVCHLPGNLLAEGQILVDVQIAAPRTGSAAVHERDVVAFQVVDRSTGEGARGTFARAWPGVVRPKLDWHRQYERRPST